MAAIVLYSFRLTFLYACISPACLALKNLGCVSPCIIIQLARPRPTTLLPPRSNGKPEAATAVYKLLMMDMRMPETCWAVFERRSIELRDWCIWLVWFIWKHWCLKSSQTSPVCPSGRSVRSIGKNILTEKTEVLGENPVSALVCPSQIPHDLIWHRTRDSAARGRRRIIWDMAQPNRKGDQNSK